MNTVDTEQPALYAGSLPQVGAYRIEFFPQEPQQLVGSYTLGLCGDDEDDDDVVDLDDLDDCFDDDDRVSVPLRAASVALQLHRVFG